MSAARRRPAEEDRVPHRARRRRRPRLRRAAARRRIRARRLPCNRHRSRRSQDRGDRRGHVLHPRRAHRRRRGLHEGRQLDATTDFAIVAELDTINICVPTPLRKTKDPDMSYIVSAVEAIAEHLHPGMLIVLESTTYPGHDRGSGAADARSERAEGRRRFLPRLLARARRPGQPDVQHAQRAEGRRRHDAGLRASWPARSTAAAIDTDRAGQLDRASPRW